MNHICPLCSSPLLCHIRSGKICWFCRRCYQEIPFAFAGKFRKRDKQTDIALIGQTERETIQQLQQISPANPLDLKEIIQSMVVGIRQFLQSDRVLVCQVKDNGQINVLKESVSFGNKTMIRASIGHFLTLEEVGNFRKGKIQVVEDNGEYQSNILEDFFEIKAKLIVPILVKEQENQNENKLWGMLIAHQCSRTRKWQESEIGFLSLMANQIAISIQQNQLQENLAQLNQKLSHIVSIDDLTQVANQRYFREYLDQQWQEMLDKHLPLSLIICDLDIFRKFNQTYGIKKGDEYLQKIAQAIKRSVKRQKDMVARYRSEKFIVLLPDTDDLGSSRVAKLIQEEIYSLNIQQTISMGCSCLVPGADISPNKLIQLAEEALAKAKNEGGDQFISAFVSDQINHQKSGRLGIKKIKQNIYETKDILKSYLAYFISRGKSIISQKKGEIVYTGLVYQYQGYHRDFENFWRDIQVRSDFAQLYIEGDLQSFQDFLVGFYHVEECARCNLPIPIPTGAAYDIPSCRLCEKECYFKVTARREQVKTNVVVVGKPPSNIYSWQNLLARNNFAVSFIPEVEAVNYQPIEEPVEMVLIDRDINKNTAENLAKELRQNPKLRQVPIIALSPTAGNGLPWLERNLEIEDYLLVPLNGEYLARNLRQQSNQLYWFPV
jgi:diguanylate cyclase (GGDEF)-like protein